MARIAVPLLLVVVSLVAGQSAQAQGSGVNRNDPSADSPSGVTYELPLDTGRKDAAPRKQRRKRSGPRRGKGTGDQATGGSPIRSENNFGSSSRVPGADDGPSRGASAGDKGGSDDGDDSSSGGAGAGGGGRGDAGGDDPTQSNRDKRLQTASTDPSDGPSDAVVFPLLALLVLVGVGVAVIAARRGPKRNT